MKAASSTYPHSHTSLGKIDEGLVAISGTDGSGLAVELFDKGDWVEQPSFPQNGVNFWWYSVATVDNNLYVMG